MLHILIIDDSRNDAELLTHKLLEAGLEAAPRYIQSPIEALAYLKGEGKYSDRAMHPLPSVIILDLAMPGTLDGFALLQWIKSQPHLGRVIVIVVTGLQDSNRIKRAYDLGAHSYLSKDANTEEVWNMVRFIHGYMRVAEALPKAPLD